MKLSVRLSVDESGWPPFASESLWCEEAGNHFKVLNTPFFVKGLGLHDVIHAHVDADANVDHFEVIEFSGNSTVWVFAAADFRSELLKVLAELKKKGCGYEGEPVPGYFAINVPSYVAMLDVDKSLSQVAEISIAYPANRHAE